MGAGEGTALGKEVRLVVGAADGTNDERDIGIAREEPPAKNTVSLASARPTSTDPIPNEIEFWASMLPTKLL